MRGDGRLYLRGGTWYADYTTRGQRVRTSTEIASDAKGKGKREANDWLRQRIEEGKAGTVAPQADKVTLAELVDAYLLDRAGNKSVHRAKRRWEKHLAPFFGNIKAVRLTTDLLRTYIAKRQAERDGKGKTQPEPGTINRELAVVSAALHLGRAEGKVRMIPHIPLQDEDNTRTGYLHNEQYDRLATECGKIGLWLRAIFECAFQYGWRLHELIPERAKDKNGNRTLKGGLRVCQCDFDHGLVLLNPGETKNGEGREAPMIGHVESLLKACCAGKQPTDYVFTRNGNGSEPVRDFAKTWKKVTAAVGVPGLLFHDLRRTGVRNMVLAGIPDKVAMEISGHNSRAIFDRYNIKGRDLIEDARRKMETQNRERQQLRHTYGTGAPATPAQTQSLQ